GRLRFSDDDAVCRHLPVILDQAQPIFGNVHEEVALAKVSREPTPTFETDLDLAALLVLLRSQLGKSTAQACVLTVLGCHGIEDMCDAAHGYSRIDKARHPRRVDTVRCDEVTPPAARLHGSYGKVARNAREGFRRLPLYPCGILRADRLLKFGGGIVYGIKPVAADPFGVGQKRLGGLDIPVPRGVLRESSAWGQCKRPERSDGEKSEQE